MIEEGEWYRAGHRERQAALRRQTRRKLWLVRAAIGVLFAIVFALAVSLLGNVATNIQCNRGFLVIIVKIGGGCPGGAAALRPRS